jgi:hypothetical protein
VPDSLEAGPVALACGSRHEPHSILTTSICIDPSQGGNAIWGNSTGAADDLMNSTHTHGEFVTFRSISGVDEHGTGNLTAEKVSNYVLEHTPSSFQVSNMRLRLTRYQFQRRG